jgi:hypothetical protein
MDVVRSIGRTHESAQRVRRIRPTKNALIRDTRGC